MEWFEHVFDISIALLASSGFWAFIQTRRDKNNSDRKLLLGLAHDRIMFVGGGYIKRGWITKEEYDDFCTYLYDPYEKSGGNGSGAKIKRELDKLPFYKPITWPSEGENDDSSTKSKGV